MVREGDGKWVGEAPDKYAQEFDSPTAVGNVNKGYKYEARNAPEDELGSQRTMECFSKVLLAFAEIGGKQMESLCAHGNRERCVLADYDATNFGDQVNALDWIASQS